MKNSLTQVSANKKIAYLVTGIVAVSALWYHFGTNNRPDGEHPPLDEIALSEHKKTNHLAIEDLKLGQILSSDISVTDTGVSYIDEHTSPELAAKIENIPFEEAEAPEKLRLFFEDFFKDGSTLMEEDIQLFHRRFNDTLTQFESARELISNELANLPHDDFVTRQILAEMLLKSGAGKSILRADTLRLFEEGDASSHGQAFLLYSNLESFSQVKNKTANQMVLNKAMDYLDYGEPNNTTINALNYISTVNSTGQSKLLSIAEKQKAVSILKHLVQKSHSNPNIKAIAAQEMFGFLDPEQNTELAKQMLAEDTSIIMLEEVMMAIERREIPFNDEILALLPVQSIPNGE
jgi:hypothetical protein